LASEWRELTFADLIQSKVLEIGDGYRAKNSELGGGDGPIFLRAGHVRDTHIDFDGVERFHRELAAAVAPKMARRGDVIVTTKGNSTGRTSYVGEGLPPFVYSPHLSYWRSLDEQKIVPGFLRYWSRSRQFRDQLAGLAASTDMAPYLSLVDQKRLRIILPSTNEQRGIAHMLGTLDDKIELNRRMNETLEAIARALFKSWFVDFDPVRAKAEGRDPGLPRSFADLFPDSFEDSELGEIPKGWRVGTLGDVAEHLRRGVQPSEIEASTPYIALEHMPRCSIALSEWGAADGLESNKLEFKRGEILFGKLRPYFHKVGVAPVDGVCSTDIVVVVPRSEKWFGFVLGHLSSDAFIEHTNAGSTGTKMPRTSWPDMAQYSVVLPPDAIAASFTERISPAVSRVLASIHESRALAALRDILLPKLISGELRVTDAHRPVLESQIC
jgi:type I restriction enzyme S subunit